MPLSPEQRKVYDRARHQREHQAMMADPVLRAQSLARQRELRRLRKRRNMTLPPDVKPEVQRTYGPWAPLFSLQAAA